MNYFFLLYLYAILEVLDLGKGMSSLCALGLLLGASFLDNVVFGIFLMGLLL